MTIDLALFEPDIPQNTGSLMRLAACLGVRLHVIEPCGFVLDSKEIKRVAMDYGVQADVQRHISWEQFLASRGGAQAAQRLILLSTKATESYAQFTFQPGDILLLGRESSGVPDAVVKQVDALVKVPMHPAARSLNVALAASMVLGEALRQTGSMS